jgi:hypothetical protein
MNYLKDPHYYADLYDLITIRQCLNTLEMFKKIANKMSAAEDLKHLSPEEKDRSLNMMYNLQMMHQKAARFKRRTETIESWIDSDRAKEDKYENTPPPDNIVCDACNSPMQVNLKELMYHDEPMRVLFFFDCPQCKSRRAVYDSGTEFEARHSYCPKCKSELDHSYKRKKDIGTWITKCTRCEYSETEITDYKKQDAERKQEADADKALLVKYRDEFCFGEDEGNKYVDMVEEMQFANDVYQSEKEKYEDPVYEKAANINQLSIAELENLLTTNLLEHKFHKLSLDKPEINQFIVVPFNLQDADPGRNSADSCKQLEQCLNNILKTTNWRLMKDSVSYRLGYVSGRLKGYERAEDLHDLLGKKKTKVRKEIDPQLQQKYGGSNLVSLGKLIAEIESVENIRKKRLLNEPEGFFLDDNPGGWYSCKICHQTRPGSKIWWTPDGLTCADCHQNIKSGVIPVEVLQDDKIWMESWRLRDEFGITAPTIRKLTKNGELVGRELRNEAGNVYYTIYLVAENHVFIKSHPRKSGAKKRWYYIDSNGEIIW